MFEGIIVNVDDGGGEWPWKEGVENSKKGSVVVV